MSTVKEDVKEIRQGEEIDETRLAAYLKNRITGLEGDMAIRQFSGGHSNLTYLITFGNRQMVLRRPPFGSKVKSAHDMGREYAILSALNPGFPLAPKPLAHTEDTDIIGCPFYVMERLHGTILRSTIPQGMVLTKEDARQLCRNIMHTLSRLHDIDYQEIGLESFGKPEGYVKRQVDGWNLRYQDARTPDVPDGERIMAWLAEHMPPDSRNPAIIHGDWKPDNLVLDPKNPTKIIGVLDWEMATVGNPFMDACYTLIFFNEKKNMNIPGVSGSIPAILRESVSREEMLEYYQEFFGCTIHNPDYYFAFNLFRLATLLQQIYYRFYHGITKDKRFEAFRMVVQMLMAEAQKIIQRYG